MVIRIENVGFFFFFDKKNHNNVKYSRIKQNHHIEAGQDKQTEGKECQEEAQESEFILSGNL